MGKKEDIATFSLKFEHDVIEATLRGTKNTLRKVDMAIDEECDIQKILFDNSVKHTKDLIHFQVTEKKAHKVWNLLKGNGWK